MEQLTLQHFHEPSPQSALQNQDAHLPETLWNWPPILITNFVYAYAVFKCWGKMDAVDTLQKLARDTCYKPQSPAQTAKHAADDTCSKEKMARSAQLNGRNNQGAGEEEKEMDIDVMDILMFLQYQSLASNAPPMQQGPCPEDVSTEKVQAWLQAH